MAKAAFKINKKSQKTKKPYEKIKDKLEIIKKAVLETVPTEKIYLFGSYAYGKPHDNSDIDIYVVIPNDFDKDILNTMGLVINYLWPYDILNIDLFLVKKNLFLFYKENRTFEETICNKGILLYERS